MLELKSNGQELSLITVVEAKIVALIRVSQVELAANLGVSYDSVNSWE
ncbi:hypothetical protein [Iningainema tapete]|uniref:Uncharacterized protein n=1 Tax=Iningainema tapete BLCC-T55 TaxID=2748662 RepID=A0A8J7C667_9CYAN|nr:hypothetical protein [Iningainema tapete]MBD2773939.1 hypothetical protein [Iningainema tapete BLCC-T55]